MNLQKMTELLQQRLPLGDFLTYSDACSREMPLVTE